MSTLDTPYLEREHLRDIIEKVPNYRQQAADILWLMPDKEAADLKCLVKHVPRYAEKAAEALVKLNGICPLDLDVIFEQVSSITIRILAGRTIIGMEKGWHRYAKVITEVPELRSETLELLLDVGPSDHWDLHAIWQFADPSVRPVQWHKYCQKDRSTTWLNYIILENRYPDLVQLAFSKWIESWKWEESDIWDFKLHELLENPVIQYQTWDWIITEGKMKVGLALDVVIKNGALRERAWNWLKTVHRKEDWTARLLNIATYDKNPYWLREMAAREALSTAQAPYQLAALTCVDPVRNEAARKLLEGFMPNQSTA